MSPPGGLRQLLHQAVVADLLGPAEGPDEEIVDASVRSRYLVGQLAPMNLVLEPDEQDELPKEGTTVNDDGESEEDRLQSESLMPSSIGLTLAVDGDTDRIRVEARWGRYERTKSELGLLTEGGQAKTVWKRRSAGGPVDIDLSDPTIAEVPDEDSADVFVRGTVRPTSGGDRLVTLFLVTNRPSPSRTEMPPGCSSPS